MSSSVLVPLPVADRAQRRQRPNQTDSDRQTDKKLVAIFVCEGIGLIDIGGPAAVFQTASEQLIRTGLTREDVYAVELLSRDGGVISTDIGAGVETRTIRSIAATEIDTLLVTGATERARCDPEIVAWLSQARPHVRRLGSTCTGSLLLAATGMLDGLRAATHWAHCARMEKLYPEVHVDHESIFVIDDGIWTSAGSTAGMDMALAMVEQDFGRELALQVARRLVIFLKRPGGQSQFSPQLESQAVEGPLAHLLEWIVANPDADLGTEALAERAHMSLRNFHRAFTMATGSSPAEWVERARMEVAKRLLEQTQMHVQQVARSAGFGNYERMRRAFARRIGITPAEYRERFARTALVRNPSIEAGMLLSAGA